MAYVFEFVLGSDVVKRVVFATENGGTRELRSSGGQKIGRLVVRRNSARLELTEMAAKTIADAQFH
jgi:hypothetical protein